MKEIQFNLNERPKTDAERVAYLVDKTNVDLIQQLIEKYYTEWLVTYNEWHGKPVIDRIHLNPEKEYIIYFGTKSIGWDDAHDTVYEAIAYSENYDIYYIIPQPTVMTME